MSKLIFLLLLVLPHMGRSEGVPWAYITSLEFAESSIGLAFFEGNNYVDGKETKLTRYYKIDNSTWIQTEIDGKTYFRLFVGAKERLLTPINYNEAPQLITSPTGNKFETEYKECSPQEEGDPPCAINRIKKGDTVISLKEAPCQTGSCKVTTAELWENQLWLGLGRRGEYGWNGYGYLVYDINSKKLLKKHNLSEMANMLISLFKTRDNKIFVASSSGLFEMDKNFKVLRSCKIEAPQPLGDGKFLFNCK